VTLAHPVSGHPHVEIPLALTAGGAALLVFVVALALPARPDRATTPADTDRSADTSWEGLLSKPQVAVRLLAVVLLALTIIAGRLGADDELENLAPALVVGAGWPLLVVASSTLGPVWRWTDPWDGLARALSRHEREESPPAAHVWPAVVVLLPVLWFVSAYPDPLDPRAVGTALAVYTIVTVAGCVALGRQRWLGSWEPLGTVLGWMALLPRGRLWDWTPPRGAEALLGAFAGGVLFGAVRRSGLWSGIAALPTAQVLATAGLLACCAVFAALFALMARAGASTGGRPGVARSVVPALAGIATAVALERDRFFTSVQLLPGLLGDPFGLGWDLLGPAVDGLDPAPLGGVGLLVAELAVLVAAHVAGAFAAAVRLRDTARLPAALVLLHLMALSVVAVAVH
jgi:hypothetical protein